MATPIPVFFISSTDNNFSIFQLISIKFVASCSVINFISQGNQFNFWSFPFKYLPCQILVLLFSVCTRKKMSPCCQGRHKFIPHLEPLNHRLTELPDQHCWRVKIQRAGCWFQQTGRWDCTSDARWVSVGNCFVIV